MHCFSAKFHSLRRVAVALVVLLLCVSLWVPTVAAAPLASGKCGPLTWSLSGGTLSVTGKGAIPDFSVQEPAPWAEHREGIFRLELDKRITAIGNMAFYNHTQLKAVTLPEKVTTVGDYAFAGCEALTSVTLPKVTAIGKYAFTRCFDLYGVQLPDTLERLGGYAFYRCESLRTVRVPAGVTEMGGSVFAYCAALLRAEIAAPLTALPEWTFYGCERLQSVSLPAGMNSAGASAFTRCDVLTVVYHNGTEEDKAHLAEDIAAGLKQFTVTQIDPSPEVPPSVSEKTFEEDGDSLSEITTEIATTEDAVVETETILIRPIVGEMELGDEEALRIDIQATIRGEEGWDALIREIEKQEIQQGTFEMKHDAAAPLTAQVLLMEKAVIRGETLKALAGKDVTLKVRTPGGSRWSIDCSLLKGRAFKKSYDMTYTLTRYEAPSEAHKKVIGAAVSYWLSFAAEIDFPATVEVYIDPTAARQTATVYENVWAKGLQKLQSVLVGEDGVASYRMANVNKGKRYAVALNVSGVSVSEAIIPDDLMSEYGNLENYVPVTEQYVITDVRGFMGMTMKDFTVVLACGVGGLALIIGVVMLVLALVSKKRALEEALAKK